MKKKLCALFAWVMIICFVVPTAIAIDGSQGQLDPTIGQPGTVYTVHEHSWKKLETRSKPATCTEPGFDVFVCECGEGKDEVVPAKGHSWGEWKTTKEANCKEEGKQVRTCSACGAKEEKAIAKNNAHQWGNWTVTKEATCKEDGVQTRTCSLCGKQETKTISKNDAHKWSDWKVTKEPTCTERGKKQRHCDRCGKTETYNIKELGHEAGEWTVTKEPTCKKTGEKEAACIRCGKVMTKKLNRVDHDYEEWETIEDATDFSKGKRQSACRFCQRKKTEEFYPEGTLAKDLDNDPDDVKELQAELKLLGLYKKELTGKFDRATIDAVKKAEKGLSLKQDGIAWPGLRKLLLGPGKKGGLGGGDPENGIGPDPSKYKLQLKVKRTSPQKDYYNVDDKITYEWTLTNTSTKASCKKTKVYYYDINYKGAKQKEVEIEDIGTLKPGESATGTYVYTVTKEDVINGKFRHGFIGRGNLGGGKTASNTVMFTHYASAASTGGTGKSGWTPPNQEALTITKTVTNTPKNTLFFVKGETIKFRIEVKNTTTDPVEDVIITDVLLGSGWKKTIGTLAGSESKAYDVEYVVTAPNVNVGEVINTAVVSYTQDGKAKVSKVSAKAKTGMNSDGLYVFKTCTNLPKNGLFFVPGETVEFEIQIINPTSDKTFKNLNIYDWLHSKTKTYKKQAELKPGKSITFTYKTRVTQYQGKTGKLTNHVVVRYTDPKKKNKVAQSNECTVPCGLEGQDGVIVAKKVISAPDNGSYYTEGEEIRYQIEVTNNTVKDIIDMAIRDSLAEQDDKGYRTVQAGETLKAGETYSIHFSYFVTEDDVANTKVTNIASANWTVKKEKDEYTETYSEPVIVPTAPVVSNRKPEMKKIEGDACIPALTGVGEGVAQRELTECTDHTETAQEAEKLISSGAYEEASQLWENDIEDLYLEWERGTEGETRRIAENEQAAFEHQMTALDASLSLVCDDQEVQAIMTAERMEKCISLCYELHTAPEERPDSTQGTHKELAKGKNIRKCRLDVSYTEAGPVHLEECQCESHIMINQLTQAYLETAEDDDDREIAWLRTQSNWLLELDTMYDTWYLSADPAQQALIAADRMSFDELINARREALEYMYPDDPAAAAEVLSNMIMHRTELICSILHKAGVLKD